MSHYGVIVITKPDENREEAVDRLLAPYHEFESTGIDDEYVEEVDKTEEARADYEKSTTTVLKDSEGNIHTFFDEKGEWKKEFSKPRDDSPLNSSRERFVPEGYEQIEVPTSTLETFAQFTEDYHGTKPVPYGESPDLAGEHKYGYMTLDEKGEVVKVIRRTNINSHWDWWVEGGRWSGFLLRKDGKEVDYLTVGELDIEGKKAQIAKEVTEDWNKAHAIIAGRPIPNWTEIRERHGDANIEAARAEYHDNQVIKDFAAAQYFFWSDGPYERYSGTLEEKIAQKQNAFISTYAVVDEAGWHAKGKMGWFGLSNDAQTQEEWDAEVAKLILSLPSDYSLTVVDCHI